MHLNHTRSKQDGQNFKYQNISEEFGNKAKVESLRWSGNVQRRDSSYTGLRRLFLDVTCSVGGTEEDARDRVKN